MTANIRIQQIEIGPMQNYGYLVVDSGSGQAAVIDPGWDTDLIGRELRRQKLTLSAVLLTHGHFDHVQEVQTLLDSGFQAPVYAHEAEKPLLREIEIPFSYVQDGARIGLGSLEIRCLHTPGHSPGCQCFLLSPYLFTGDTLFIDHVGRMDLPGGSPAQMFASMGKIRALPDETIVFPGHRYHALKSDSLGNQKRTNPFLRAASLEEFLQIC